MSLPTIRAELAAAIRAVNAAYGRIPAEHRPNVRWGLPDDLLEEALAGNRSDALAAIEAWRDHWLALFDSITEKLAGCARPDPRAKVRR
jgi:hypothetical protein